MSGTHPELTMEQLQAFELYRSGTLVAMVHLPCEATIHVNRKSVAHVLGLAAEHHAKCEAVR
jgi:hypothetical protein